MTGLNVLSLFDGMSCGRIALENAAIPVNQYFSSEVDKYAIQVSQENYPEIILVFLEGDWLLTIQEVNYFLLLQISFLK
jgi:site-specific DNA-cytosine methylase